MEPTAKSVEQQPSDAELMQRMAQGDMGALREVYVRYSGYIERVLIRYRPGLPRDEIADLCQEVFLTALDIAPRYRERGKLSAWLCGIALKKSRRRWERQERRRGLLARFGRDTTPRNPLPDSHLSERRMLEDALNRLPTAQRDVLVLHALEQLSGEEIATALGVKVNTVWTRLHRARAGMRAALARHREHGDPGGDVATDEESP